MKRETIDIVKKERERELYTTKLVYVYCAKESNIEKRIKQYKILNTKILKILYDTLSFL